MKIEKIPAPQTQLLKSALSKIDYSDAYTCKFEAADTLIVDDFVKGFFSAAPKWVENLFIVRNKIVRLAGLKVPDLQDREAALAAFKIEKGHQLGLFKIIDRTENEVLMGEDDKHLDFRISFILEKSSPSNHSEQPLVKDQQKGKSTGSLSLPVNENLISYEFTVTTLVAIKNILGRLYFLPVKPMHKIVVVAMMRNIIKNIKKKKMETY